MTTLAGGGRRSARCDRPYSSIAPCSTTGAPKIEKSRGVASLTLPLSSLASSDDAWIAFRRSTGSLMSVARLHSITDTWLFDSVLPGSRSDTGTNATSGSLGRPCFSSR